MGKTDGGKENRQQLYNPKTDRTVEKTGGTKTGKRLGTIFLLVIVLVISVTSTCVQAIELGGFDVDMGTGSFEEENSEWDQDSGIAGETDSGNYDNENDNQNSDSWDTDENMTTENATQPEIGWENSFSTGQYENSNSFYSGNLEENREVNEHSGNTDIVGITKQNSESTEEQISEEDIFSGLSPTPTILPTATSVPTPISSISSTPVPESTQDILTLPEKEEELPDEECRQKMQIIYCKKEIQSASRVKIHPNPQLAAAVLSVRINGKETDWHSVGGIIFLNMTEEQECTEIETAVMCSRELSWTEVKKNAILTYTIF